MESGPTPHLEGVYGDYAPTVLLPGDPKRARFIAENYLTNIKLVNSVRGAEGFTGEFNGYLSLFNLSGWEFLLH